MMSEPSGSSFKPLEGASLLARYAVWIIAFHLFSGAALLSWIEGWDPFTALYFCIICVTTVGYGDVVPATKIGKAFTTFYILLGVSLIASCIGILVGAVQAKARQASKTDESGGSNLKSTLIRAAGQTAACVVAGTAYGTFVEGWDLGDSFYWTVVSISSVGFGDICPTQRVLVTIFLLIGVTIFLDAAGRIASAVSIWELEREVKSFIAQGVSPELIETLDVDGSGSITRDEFLRYMLVAMGKVEESDMNLIDGIFKSFDADGSGSIDADDIRHMHAAKMARTREEMSSGLRERNADGSSSSTY